MSFDSQQHDGVDQDAPRPISDSDVVNKEEDHHRRREREGRILAELSAVVNTLDSISHVMDDILELTDTNAPTEQHGKSNTAKLQKRNIIMKQQLLLEELRKWDNVARDDD